jgi:predicted nucleic acid-binding protein
MTMPAVLMTGDRPRQGLLDTNIVVLRKWIDPQELPEEMAISAITLAELSAGPHEVRRNHEQDAYDEHAERARRLEILQRAESEFDPVPFDADARSASRRPAGCNSRRTRAARVSRRSVFRAVRAHAWSAG